MRPLGLHGRFESLPPAGPDSGRSGGTVHPAPPGRGTEKPPPAGEAAGRYSADAPCASRENRRDFQRKRGRRAATAQAEEGIPSPKAGSHPGGKDKLKYSPEKASGPPSLQPPMGRSGRAGSASAEGGYAVLPIGQSGVCFLSKRYGRARNRPKKQNRRCLRHRKERFRMRLFHKTSPLSPCAALPTCRKSLVCGGNPPGCRPGNREGLGDGAFGPGAPITREQPAAMPCRYHQRQGGVLDAGGTAARSEIAAMMQRFPAATGKQETTGTKQCGWDPNGSQPHCFVPPGALIYHGRNGRRS